MKKIKNNFVICLIILSVICGIKIANIKTVKTKAAPQKVAYTVKNYNGKIAVFENESQTPLQIFETPLINELPIADRKKLQQGITVTTKSELTLLLQDYDN